MLKTKKIVFVCSFMTLAIWYSRINNYIRLLDKNMDIDAISKNSNNMKYILQWTKSYTEPFIFMGRGARTFIRRQCKINNCYITSDRKHLNSLKDFDAILFHGPEISSTLIRLPGQRSLKQKYVFVSKESSRIYPIHYNVYDAFFNWSWTYRLDSDVYYGYVIIKNKQGSIIGPKEVMHWLKVEEMKPVDDKIKEKLKSKRIAAAWFASNCQTPSRREKVAELLKKELAKYNMTVDIYGACGNKYCPRDHMKECLRMLESDYYFYLAFENTITKDYVTEKLLHALQHYAVPIVYGGANYTRFMPDGTYLSVYNQRIKGLVKQMVDLINDKQKYYDYFKWMNHYSYHYGEEFPNSDYYCDFCSKINDLNVMNRTSIIKNFKNWWNPKSKNN